MKTDQELANFQEISGLLESARKNLSDPNKRSEGLKSAIRAGLAAISLEEKYSSTKIRIFAILNEYLRFKQEPKTIQIPWYDNFGGFTFSPDRKMFSFYGGRHDSKIKIRDTYTLKELQSFPGLSRGVDVVRFSPDGKILASGSVDKTIKIWDIDSGQEIKTINAISKVRLLSFSPDGKVLASADPDGRIQLWNLETGEEINNFSGGNNSHAVIQLSFTPDNTFSF